MSSFKNRLFGSPVPKVIRDRFKKLEGPSVIEDPLAAQNPSFDEYLGSRTPFARMWTAVSIEQFSETPPNGEQIHKYSNEEAPDDAKYYYQFKNFKHGDKIPLATLEPELRSFVVNENFTSNYKKNKTEMFGISINELSQNQLKHPAAGITSISSKTQGAVGALINTSVEFKVFDLHDFENIFLPYFMRPGSIVCVDFGWSDIPGDLYDPNDHINENDTEMSGFDAFLYGTTNSDGKFIKGELEKKEGKMRTVMGNVVKYDSKVQSDGSFDCSIEIVSRNHSVLNRAISGDSKIKFIFSNLMDDLLALYLIRLEAQLGSTIKRSDIKEGFSNDGLEAEQVRVIETIINTDGNVDFRNETRALMSAITSGQGTTLGRVTDFGKRHGVFFQNLTKIVSQEDQKEFSLGLFTFDERDVETENRDESSYISWGLFEDNFLNKFITPIRKKSITENETGTPEKFEGNYTEDFGIKFDSRGTFVRWSEDLNELQYSTDEELPVFMYPDEWDTTYNYRTANWTKEELKPPQALFEGTYEDTDLGFTQKCKLGEFPGYKNISVCPLRDVFVSVSVIEESFRTANSVDKAIISILDKMSMASGTIWNLKISAMEGNTKVSVQDINLMPGLTDDDSTLKFNVTGNNTIVSEFDISYSTPSDGLASILAIGNLTAPTQVNDLLAGTLNYLNLLNKPGKGSKFNPTLIKSLPIKGEVSKDSLDLTGAIDVNSFLQTANNSVSSEKELTSGESQPNVEESTDVNLSENMKEARANRLKLYKLLVNKKIKDYKKSTEETGQTNSVSKSKQKTSKKDIDFVKSDREYFKEIAKQRFFHKSGDESVSPILPIKLSMTVYGNDNLKIGDYLTVNYLPKFYRDRVFFQTYGITHKIDANTWSTTYDPLVFRVRPNVKGLATGGMVKRDVRKIVDGDINKVLGGITNDTIVEILEDLTPNGSQIIRPSTIEPYQPPYIKFSAKIHTYVPSDNWNNVFRDAYIPSDMPTVGNGHETGLNVRRLKTRLKFATTASRPFATVSTHNSAVDFAFANALRDVLFLKGVLKFREGIQNELKIFEEPQYGKNIDPELAYFASKDLRGKSFIFTKVKDENDEYLPSKFRLPHSEATYRRSAVAILRVVQKLTKQWDYDSYDFGDGFKAKFELKKLKIGLTHLPKFVVEDVVELPPLFTHYNFNVRKYSNPEDEIKVFHLKTSSYANDICFQDIFIPKQLLNIPEILFINILQDRFIDYMAEFENLPVDDVIGNFFDNGLTRQDSALVDTVDGMDVNLLDE